MCQTFTSWPVARPDFTFVGCVVYRVTVTKHNQKQTKQNQPKPKVNQYRITYRLDPAAEPEKKKKKKKEKKRIEVSLYDQF